MAKKKVAKKSCKGIRKSGKHKGTIKKGYTHKGVKKGKCPRKIAKK